MVSLSNNNADNKNDNIDENTIMFQQVCHKMLNSQCSDVNNMKKIPKEKSGLKKFGIEMYQFEVR
jgi:hypothetical protein